MTPKPPKVNQKWQKFLIFVVFLIGAELCSGQGDPFAVRSVPAPAYNPTYASQTSSGSANAVPNYSFLRQRQFSIPYQMQAGPDSNLPLTLFISDNLGQSWKIYQTVTQSSDPQKRRFEISLPGDGEYWFTTRAGAFDNAPLPANMQPILRVVIDTTPPVIQIETKRIANSITVFWTLFDKYPAPESVKFSYRFRNNAPWQPVQIDAQSIRPHSTGISGQFNVPLLRGINYLEIQGEGQDKTQIPTLFRSIVPLDSPADQRQVVHNQQSGALIAGNGQRDEYLSALPHQQQSASKPIPDGGSSQGSGSGLGWSPDRTSSNNEYNQSVPAPSPYGSTQNETSIYNDSVIDLSTASIIGTSRFEMQYDIEAVGRSGIGTVELWYTKDQGKTWELLARDPDTLSPVEGELPEPGIYGLKLVIRNGAGIGDSAPLPHETPQSWIIWDKTPPTGQLTNADIRLSAALPQMRLGWRTSDAYSMPKPVQLSWSDKKDGGWRLIADQLDASGEYLWTMPTDVPAKICIKLEVFDRGNNKSVFITSDIASDASHPRGFIRQIRPVGVGADAKTAPADAAK